MFRQKLNDWQLQIMQKKFGQENESGENWTILSENLIKLAQQTELQSAVVLGDCKHTKILKSFISLNKAINQ